MILRSLYSLSYLGENVNMVRLVLPDFLRRKHLLHIHKWFDDADARLSIVRCNETRFIAVGSLKFHLIFILLIGNINYYYVCFKTVLSNGYNSLNLRKSILN